MPSSHSLHLPHIDCFDEKILIIFMGHLNICKLIKCALT